MRAIAGRSARRQLDRFAWLSRDGTLLVEVLPREQAYRPSGAKAAPDPMTVLAHLLAGRGLVR
jgi:hypothetical protein